jgi:uncharacterized membrane protein
VKSSRLEAFSDGVLAIVITIMVLELKPPHGDDIPALIHTSGLGLLTYVLSFIYIGIYWNNHHHLFQLRPRVDGTVLWANLHLLFWLSLFPFTTAWLDDSTFARWPTVVYGVDLLAAAVAYYLLQRALMRGPEGARIQEALGRDLKGRLSPIFYLVGIALCFVVPWLGMIPYVAVAVIWLVPDRRIERYLRDHADAEAED